MSILFDFDLCYNFFIGVNLGRTEPDTISETDPKTGTETFSFADSGFEFAFNENGRTQRRHLPGS